MITLPYGVTVHADIPAYAIDRIIEIYPVDDGLPHFTETQNTPCAKDRINSDTIAVVHRGDGRVTGLLTTISEVITAANTPGHFVLAISGVGVGALADRTDVQLLINQVTEASWLASDTYYGHRLRLLRDTPADQVFTNGPVDLGDYSPAEVDEKTLTAIRVARDLWPEAAEFDYTTITEKEYARGTVEFIRDYFGLGGDEHDISEVYRLVYGTRID